jgi:hypothetical protein
MLKRVEESLIGIEIAVVGRVRHVRTHVSQVTSGLLEEME